MIKPFKKQKEKITAITAYDYSLAKIIDSAGIDIILVGDSLGMVLYGYKDTRKVKMRDMLIHTSAVARAVKNAHIIGDMPYHSYENPKQATKNAKSFIKAGAGSVKIEGNKPIIIKALISNKIPVMGHIGLTPQTIKQFKVQGKDNESKKRLLSEAKSLEKAGCYAIVLESIPKELAKKITQSISIPTIGIGAGKYCDGQVLVSYDMFGLFTDFKPRFVKNYEDLAGKVKKAVENYINDVKTKKFPNEENSY